MAPATTQWLLQAGLVAAGLALVVGGDLHAENLPDRAGPDTGDTNVHLAIVRHHWQATIVESNHAALRPGSVYDMITYFEQNFGLARPTFNYRFLDTGLGTADPLYPLYQSGFQAGWNQLLPAFFSRKNRHLDHFSTVRTPEGCQVDAIYLVRHIDELIGHLILGGRPWRRVVGVAAAAVAS